MADDVRKDCSNCDEPQCMQCVTTVSKRACAVCGESFIEEDDSAICPLCRIVALREIVSEMQARIKKGQSIAS